MIRTKRKSKWGCHLTTQQITAEQSNSESNCTAVRIEFFQRIKRASAIEQKAIPRQHRYAPAPSRVTEISPGPACNSFRALPRLCRAQTGRKKAPYPQIVYLLIRENNWVEFIISRVPAHRRALLFLFVFMDPVLYSRVDCTYIPRFIPLVSSSVLLNGCYILRHTDNVWKVRSVERMWTNAILNWCMRANLRGLNYAKIQ